MPGTVQKKYLLFPIYKLCLVNPIRAVSLILEGGALTLLMNSQLAGELATQQLNGVEDEPLLTPRGMNSDPQITLQPDEVGFRFIDRSIIPKNILLA